MNEFCWFFCCARLVCLLLPPSLDRKSTQNMRYKVWPGSMEFLTAFGQMAKDDFLENEACCVMQPVVLKMTESKTNKICYVRWYKYGSWIGFVAFVLFSPILSKQACPFPVGF